MTKIGASSCLVQTSGAFYSSAGRLLKLGPEIPIGINIHKRSGYLCLEGLCLVASKVIHSYAWEFGAQGLRNPNSPLRGGKGRAWFSLLGS